MRQEYVIDLVQSYEDWIKEKLREFCGKTREMARARDDNFKLMLEMSFWERKASWFPGVRGDRHDRYNKQAKQILKLQDEEIPALREEIIKRINDNISNLNEAQADLDWGDEREFYAVGKALTALCDFLEKFSRYPWYLKLGDQADVLYYSSRYPRIKDIYVKALEDFGPRQQ